MEDAPAVRVLVDSAEVATMMLHIPHPYPEGLAEKWIEARRAAAERGTALTWAISRRADTTLMGSITLSLVAAHRRAELGYWLGVPFWNQGYVTEAVRRVLAFGFHHLQLHRVQATCFQRNLASARVLEKAGLRYEGLLRGFFRKGEISEDVRMYGIVRTDLVP
jgi:RimJ/RimL family protein N-acetyltransferase